ncbi:efflux RND transporter periplasmic adaptor subunit [Veillonella sp. CHU740]|uniref:efflux RND transporter periplasmic adaptor subunit n=1 Tax=Veillonella sp. CHU740 TaxID=2490950 RepID=UPI000F8CC07A|nr:efflux RND transporter periplasmic adaptor subunit [Veillonella sp. CHU740]
MMKYGWIRTYWKYIAIVSVVVIVGAVYMMMQPTRVQVEQPVERQMPVRISHEANITALHKASIESPVSGSVSAFTVKVGDTVKAGQVLALIDTTSLQQQLQMLLGQLQEARSRAAQHSTSTTVVGGSVSSGDVERARHMRDAGIITSREYETIAARAQSSVVSVPSNAGGSAVDTSGIEAAIAKVQAQMAAAQIVSPMDGKVAAIYNEDRKIAIEGKPLILVQQDSPVIATLSVPQSFGAILNQPNQTGSIQVYLEVDGKQIPGQITYVGVENGPSTTVKATFTVESGVITIGEFYTLVIETNAEAPALTLPKDVIRSGDDGSFVYVLTDDNTIDIRTIEVGLETDGYVTILDGLQATDRVVTTKGTFELGESVRL